tara:strand:- start:2539 stop:2892 length:354 start_codon:yes stop_codon:yes gene_type:complete
MIAFDLFHLIFGASMIELITDPTPGKISYFREILEAEGIRTFVRNENMSGTEGMIPIFHPGLCIVKHSDLGRAKQLIAQSQPSDVSDTAAEIICLACSEKNPGNFASCWNCGAELPD